MPDSFYTKHKKTTNIRTKRWAYVLSIAWLAILCITLFSRLYFVNPLALFENAWKNKMLYFILTQIVHIGFFAIIYDRLFITHIITCVFLLIIFCLVRRARSLDAMKRTDYIAIITLNLISIIIVIVRSFLPIGDSLKWF